MIHPSTLTPPELYKINKTAQRSTILVDAFEYFGALLLSGAFLASLLTKIGVPDALVGITSSLASFGYIAQFFAMFLTRRMHSAKRVVATTHVISQLLFVTLYLVPFVQVPQGVKTALFMVLYLCGSFIQYLIGPIRTNWTMSYVNPRERGSFSATKEIISLIGGMIFSWVMGSVIDHCDEIGQQQTGFIICGITIFVLSLLIMLCYLPVKELKAPAQEAEQSSVRETIKGTLGDKTFRKIIYLDVLFRVATGICTPFMGTYLNNELALGLTTIATISMVSSVARALVSKPMGRFADKTSWANSLMLCFALASVGSLINAFTRPSNGLVLYTIYILFIAVYSAGSNSGITNIVFDYAKPHLRTGAIGIKGTVGGLASVLATLVGAKIVDAVQANGNQVFGMNIYAQQILSFLACLVFASAVLYIRLVIMKLKRVEE